MGNSPSRNELHGDHMAAIAHNSSGQETYQSHNYPAKFSSVPGIHNDHGAKHLARGEAGSSGNSSGGPNTPDLLYSMDSLNVCGRGSGSMTSTELPPSSISPNREGWRESPSYSEESLHAALREKKGSVPTTPEDEGLSLSTYESDSLNPDATLSEMTPRKFREPSPMNPEIAEEAVEVLETQDNPKNPVNGFSDQFSITINGRKVGNSEENLPMLAGANGHAEKVNESEKTSPRQSPPSPPNPGGTYSSGTIKRGSRMKSPPPPPPPNKPPPPPVETKQVSATESTCPKMSSLNSLMRRNVSFGSPPAALELLEPIPANVDPETGTCSGIEDSAVKFDPSDIGIRPCEPLKEASVEVRPLATVHELTDKPTTNKTELDCKDDKRDGCGNCSPVDEPSTSQGVEFPEMDDSQLESSSRGGKHVAKAMALMFDITDAGLVVSPEEKVRGSEVDNISPVSQSPVLVKSNSKQGSRRGSLSSGGSFEGAVPPNGGICNRISLCSVPDEVDHQTNFDSPPPPVLDCDAIRDQPMSRSCEEVCQEPVKGHQRKMSLGKIDFSALKAREVLGNNLTSSCPTTPNECENKKVTRKTSFPELFVSTSNRNLVERKFSVGANDKLRRAANSEKSQVKNDFLQALGEIYATRSKQIASKPQPPSEPPKPLPVLPPPPVVQILANVIPPPPPPPEPEPVVTPKPKSREASMDTLDGFDCQDRSISEYNISPRSARELVTESLLLNGTSTVSQVSIVTISDPIPPPPPEPSRSPPVEVLTTGFNSGTFKKKPTFIRGAKVTPAKEAFESPPNEQPVPPPMPPLTYSRNSSLDASSTTTSSLESLEKSPKSSTFSNISSDASSSGRATGSQVSSECSILALSPHPEKKTSDAIIVELRRAQARKIAVAETKSEPSQITSEPRAVSTVEKPVAVNIIQVAPPSEEVKLEKEEGDQLPRGDEREPQVKTIVNGKHTNSIIVNQSPVGVGKKSPVKGGVSGSGRDKSGRGHIMSPSLSGNYTEMNGIDSDTMGASGIHEEQEALGQRDTQQAIQPQQKVEMNHVNELEGNNGGEEGTMGNLDGASFRRVLSEYEKTLSMFIQQIDQLKQRMDEAEQEKQSLIKERDQAMEDLRNVESAFSDVHRKYERAKALLENMKSNEDTLIRRDQEMMQRIQNRDKKIDMIKDKAQESIEKMHQDYESRIKEMEFENAKMRAQYRKMEMKLNTLENDVEQKAKENAQLSALCDELINGQVGQV